MPATKRLVLCLALTLGSSSCATTVTDSRGTPGAQVSRSTTPTSSSSEASTEPTTEAPTTPTSVRTRTVQPFDLKVGDCYNVKDEDSVDPTASPEAGDTIGSVTVVGCSAPHTGEVIGIDVYPPGSPWVGLTPQSKQRAFEQCDSKYFEPRVAPEYYEDEAFGQYFIYPNSLLAWQTNKKVACVVETKDKRPGSVIER